MRDFASLQGDTRRIGIALDGRWLQRRATEACLALALSPVFAWVSPFDTGEQIFLARLGFWSGMLACWFVAMAAVEVLLANKDFFRDRAPAGRSALVIGLAALPMIVIAGAAADALQGWQASVYEVAELYWQIVILGSIVALLANAVLPRRSDPVPALVEAPPQAPLIVAPLVSSSPLVARLPIAMRGRIICLEMEDHYVRVHTDRGSVLLLLRLSDAIAEAHPVKGRQVHRSWWVSDDAVEGFDRVGRVGAVRLSNGMRAPVSQRYLRSVEASFA